MQLRLPFLLSKPSKYNNYRTTKMNEVFAPIYNAHKGYIKQKPGKNAGQSSLAPPAGLEPATL
jgi:hypothetical protein